MTNLESILKSRDSTLSTKVCIVKVTVFPIVMFGCESQTIKTIECRRIDAFELWHQRRFLRGPWTTRNSKQPILKEMNPEYSLGGLLLKLKFQYLGHPLQRANSQSSLRLTSIESVMPSSHLILCHPLLLLPPIPPSIRVFSNESTLHMRWPKYWSFSLASFLPKKSQG